MRAAASSCATVRRQFAFIASRDLVSIVRRWITHGVYRVNQNKYVRTSHINTSSFHHTLKIVQISRKEKNNIKKRIFGTLHCFFFSRCVCVRSIFSTSGKLFVEYLNVIASHVFRNPIESHNSYKILEREVTGNNSITVAIKKRIKGN